MSNINPHYIILGDRFGFPNGSATTSRLRLLAHGIKQAGAFASVMIIRGSETPALMLNPDVSGVHDGISFEYTTSGTARSPAFLKRRWQGFRGVVVAMWRLLSLRRQGRLQGVILYVRGVFALFLFSWWCKVLRIPVVLELCEWPVAFSSKRRRTQLNDYLFCRFAFSWVDGAIVISRFLERKANTYAKRSGRPVRTLIVPILVDVLDFKRIKVAEDRPKAILYCGVLDYVEIVEFLLKAFDQLMQAGINVKLVIVGSAVDKANEKYLREIVQQSKHGENVTFTGYVSETVLREMYGGATVLAIPLPAGERSDARFPTKIGEYLAAGRPIVTTAVGDIALYLQDGKTAFIAEPDSIGAYAEKLSEALRAEQASMVGLAGRNVAISEFDPNKHGLRIIEFLKSISA